MKQLQFFLPSVHRIYKNYSQDRNDPTAFWNFSEKRLDATVPVTDREKMLLHGKDSLYGNKFNHV